MSLLKHKYIAKTICTQMFRQILYSTPAWQREERSTHITRSIVHVSITCKYYNHFKHFLQDPYKILNKNAREWQFYIGKICAWPLHNIFIFTFISTFQHSLSLSLSLSLSHTNRNAPYKTRFMRGKMASIHVYITSPWQPLNIIL